MSLENTPILNKNQIIESINDKISNGLNVIKNSPINIIKNTIKKNENINKAAKIINAQSVKITGEVPTEEDVVDDITTSTNSTNNFTNSTETTTEKQPKAKETYQGMAIADVFTKYGVTKQEINDAMMPLRFKNPDLANELTSYFKA